MIKLLDGWFGFDVCGMCTWVSLSALGVGALAGIVVGVAAYRRRNVVDKRRMPGDDFDSDFWDDDDERLTPPPLPKDDA